MRFAPRRQASVWSIRGTSDQWWAPVADDPDDDLVTRVRAILGERLNPEGGGCAPNSKEGCAVVMLKTLQRLEAAKERRDVDEVTWTRVHLEALLREDSARQGGAIPIRH